MTLTIFEDEANNVIDNITKNFGWRDKYEINDETGLPQKYITNVIEGEYKKMIKRSNSYPAVIRQKIEETLKSVRDSFESIY